MREPHGRRHDHVDAGGLERLDEAAGQAERHHVLVPGLLAPPGLDADEPGLLDRRAARIRDEPMARLVIRHVLAAEHDAVADAMLHGNVPAPARGVRITGRIRLGGFIDDGLERHRAVAGQPVRPVFEAGLQRAFDEQAAKAGAVDEEVALDDLALCRARAIRRSRCAACVRTCLILPSTRFTPLGSDELAQVTRVQRGIEVIGVVDARVFAQREAAFHRGQPLVAVLADVAPASPWSARAARSCGTRPSTWAGRGGRKDGSTGRRCAPQFSNQMPTLNVAAHSRHEVAVRRCLTTGGRRRWAAPWIRPRRPCRFPRTRPA